jgi:hypothetical protein
MLTEAIFGPVNTVWISKAEYEYAHEYAHEYGYILHGWNHIRPPE